MPEPGSASGSSTYIANSGVLGIYHVHSQLLIFCISNPFKILPLVRDQVKKSRTKTAIILKAMPVVDSGVAVPWDRTLPLAMAPNKLDLGLLAIVKQPRRDQDKQFA